MRDEELGGGHRHARLQQLIHEELDALLRDELGDPALETVRFTAVELSVDYRSARVYYTALDGRAARALERATPFMRSRVGDALELKRVPNLRFVVDPCTR
jgi:ribosome-binding factor A